MCKFAKSMASKQLRNLENAVQPPVHQEYVYQNLYLYLPAIYA